MLGCLLVLLWAPIVHVHGIVFTRDPAFFSTVHADVSSSLGVLSLQGGASNLATQGLFYEPYALVEALLGWAGASPGVVSKLIVIVMSALALVGSHRLLRHLDVGPWGALLGAAVYLLNPWSLDQFGYFFTWTGYCLLPTVVLGAAQAAERGRPPFVLLAAVAFSGGAVAWVVAAVAAVLTLAVHVVSHRRPHSVRKLVWMAAAFAIAGAYWILPYLAWVAQPGRSDYERLARVTDGILQSPYPVTDLLALRDFWWPHLDPTAVVGPTAAALGGLAATGLVVGTIAWCAFAWRTRALRSGHLLWRSVILLLVCGAALGTGTAGPTGWLYAGLRSWPLAGGVLVKGIMRSPSNFAGLFVFGVAIALAAGVGQMKRWRGWRKVLGVGSVCALGIVALAPSILAFWQQYRPISPPPYYARAAASDPMGVVLEVGLWQDAAISPVDGVSHFLWSKRLAADPTMLASFVTAPSLSPALAGNERVGALLAGAVTPRGVKSLEGLTTALHVRSLIIENDLVGVSAGSLPAVLGTLRRSSVSVRTIGPVAVVSLGKAAKTFVWLPGCRVASALALLGAFQFSCPTWHSRRRFHSSFELPTPLLGIGATIGPARSIDSGLGTVALLNGQSGWIVSLPGVLADFGLAVTVIGIGLAGSASASSRLRRSAWYWLPRHSTSRDVKGSSGLM